MSTLAEKVYNALSQIEEGQVISYTELARRVGVPKAVRAVATLVGKNPNPVKVPCHRVIKSNGEIGNYTYNNTDDPHKKVLLLKREGVICHKKSKMQKGKKSMIYVLNTAPKGAIL